MKRTHLIPATVFLGLVLVVMWARQLNEDNYIRSAHNNTTIEAEQLAVRLESYIATRFAIGQHLRHEWNTRQINTREEFLAHTRSLQLLFPDFQAINWVDKSGVIRWVGPPEGNEAAIDLDLMKLPAGAFLAAASKLGDLQATPPLDLAQGGIGISAYIPLGGIQGNEGFINLVFRTAPLVKAALKDEFGRTYQYQITDEERPIYNHGNIDMVSPYTVQRSLKVANRVWMIALTPKLLPSDISPSASKITVILALLISAGLSWLLWLYLRHQEESVVESKILEATLGNMDEGISMFDGNLNLMAFNHRFLELLDFPPDRFTRGTPFEAFIRFNAERGEYGEGDIDELVGERVERAKKPEIHSFERIMPNGTVLEIRGNPIPEGGFVTSYTDISERKAAEKALHQSERLFSKAFNSTPASLAIASIETGLLYDVNDHWCTTTGYDREGVIGKTAAEIGLWQNFRQRVQLIKAIRRDKSIRDFEGTLITKKGEARDCVFNAEIIEIDNEERLLLVFHDVTERKRAEDRALHLAGHDPLTGLPNRNLMRDRLEHELARAQRNSSKIAIMFIDLNDFKLVNDMLGHKAGDYALQNVAERMKKCVRASDTLARFGGDEFVIIMPDIIDQASVVRTCEKLTQSLCEPFEIDGTEMRIGASIGITLYPDHATSPEALLELADKAMYDLKRDDDSVGFKFADPRAGRV